jgi:hypothetical protein
VLKNWLDSAYFSFCCGFWDWMIFVELFHVGCLWLKANFCPLVSCKISGGQKLALFADYFYLLTFL